MAQYIKQGNIFGRIGSGIGQGLAESVPDELKYQRMKSGLSDLADSSEGLSPEQYLAKAGSVYGISPQLIQSMGELAKTQRTRNAYANTTGSPYKQSETTRTPSSPRILPRQGQALTQAQAQTGKEMSANGVEKSLPGENISAEQYGERPQINPTNPTDEALLTRLPWTPNQRNDSIGKYINMGFLPEQAERLTADDESRDLAEPDALKKRFSDREANRKLAQSELKTQLERKLQKSGENVYQDITGEMLNNIERGMERDLILNPDSSLSDVANRWTDKALETAKTKNAFDKLANTTGLEELFKGYGTLDKLKQYSKIFSDSGNSEEYANMLREKIGLSPQGAASVAYDLSGPTKNYINSLKTQKTAANQLTNPQYPEQHSRKIALELSEKIGKDDSILAAVWEIKKKDPAFDEESFFNEMQDHQDALMPRQKREIAEGKSNFRRTWGDFKIFGTVRRR